jgi:hypothetical protein
MREAIPPLPNTPSWRGAQLIKKYRDNFTFIRELQKLSQRESGLLGVNAGVGNLGVGSRIILKLILRETMCEGVDCIHLGQGRDQ